MLPGEPCAERIVAGLQAGIDGLAPESRELAFGHDPGVGSYGGVRRPVRHPVGVGYGKGSSRFVLANGAASAPRRDGPVQRAPLPHLPADPKTADVVLHGLERNRPLDFSRGRLVRCGVDGAQGKEQTYLPIHHHAANLPLSTSTRQA